MQSPILFYGEVNNVNGRIASDLSHHRDTRHDQRQHAKLSPPRFEKHLHDDAIFIRL